MTTTKEDQIRAEFRILHPNSEIQDQFAEGWKACAESYEKKLNHKVSSKMIYENLQNGLDANGWSIVGTGGTKVAFLKPLVEYLRKAGIEVV